MPSLSIAAALLAACGGSQPQQWQAQPLAQKDAATPPCSPSSSCGWTPAQLEAAYLLTRVLGRGSGTNVAIVVQGDLANASSDLAAYRNQYGLGMANLTKYNEYGRQYNYPPKCHGEGCVPIDAYLDMVSAACPKCNIFLMEAKSGIGDLETAEAEAVTLGATIVTNSWICFGSYDCGDPNFSEYFDTPGIAYLAESGNGAYDEIGAPSALAGVIAVGGTQLSVSGSKYSETIWSDSAGGCASPAEVGGSGIPKPSWQHDPDCSYRTVSDVSAEAGCSPGVAVFSSAYGGWTEKCGTGVATAFTGGVIALAGNADTMDGGKNFWTAGSKLHRNSFHHPSSGSDGTCGNYLCGDGRYKTYYSGPDGWGTPNGIKGY